MTTYANRTYPVLVDIETTRRSLLAGVSVYRGQKLMYDDGDSNYLTQAVTGDASDKFAGVATQTVLNASDVLGAAGEVWIEYCDRGTAIFELDTTPTIAHQGKPVYADANTEMVSPTEGTGFMIGFVKSYTNVSDPLGRTNAVLVQFGTSPDTST